MESISSDLIVYISMMLDLDDLLSLCISSKKINLLVCDNQKFWMEKLLKDFNIQASDLPKNYNYKNYYQYIISQIKYDSDNLDEVLVDASTDGDLNLVKIALNPPSKFTMAKPADIDTFGYVRPNHHRPNFAGPGEPLKMAAYYGHFEIVKYLIENGADTSFEIIRTTLFRAISHDPYHQHSSDLDMVKYLLEYVPKSFDIINELIDHAILEGKIYIMDYLITNFIGINNISENILKDWLRSASGNGIKDKLLDVVKYLMKYNPNKETISKTIEIADRYGNDETSKYLYFYVLSLK